MIIFFHIIKMPETKTIVLALVFIVVIGIGAYFAFFKKSSSDSSDSSGGSGGGGVKPAPTTPPETCGGQLKPVIKCEDNQKLICDKGKWRCELKCESNNNPFPTTFTNCNSDNIKCDENGIYYCKGSTECQNGGILYQDGCHCGSAFTGKQCQCSSTTCGKGKINEDCTCATCCDPSTSIDGKCKMYNGPAKKCEGNCEKEKGLNFVFDPKTGSCVCPKGFSLSPENGICKPINCGTNGTLNDDTNKCVCKSADWSGALCNNKVCGEHGRMGPDGKCVCDAGYAGSVCQFSRADCGGHGNPSVDKNDNLVCVCDADYTGAHCRCKISDAPAITDTDKCRGIYQTCDDTSGRWVRGQNPCDKIYQQYGKDGNGTSQDWVQACAPLLLSQDQQKDNETISCKSNICPIGQPNCPPEFNAYKTCASSSVKNTCKSDGTCNYCVCSISNGVPSYSCQAPQSLSECGKIPPSGFCSDGSNPLPLSVGEGASLSCLWACPGTVLPKDFALKQLASVENIKGTNAYWDNSTKTSVYPTINMDACKDNPSNLENISPFASGFRSIGGEYGFINNAKQFTSASKVPPNLIVYNYTNGQPLNNSNVVATMLQDGYGCAKPADYQSGTACRADNGVPRGQFTQNCTDLNGNPVPCSDSRARIRYDTGTCNCYTYSSSTQGKNVPYKGKYCQYSDNDNCSGNGTVDDNGNCACKPGFVGKNCQYRSDSCGANGSVNPDNGSCICAANYKGQYCQFSDQTTCKGQGTVDYNGNCGPPWVAGEVFPRCARLVNPNEPDYNKLQCAETVHPTLFSTNCVRSGLSDSKPEVYGCPIIPDTTQWMSVTGMSCHTKDLDNNWCKSGASMRRNSWDGSEDAQYNLCQADDFTNLDGLTKDKRGIQNTRVSSIGLVRQRRASSDDEVYAVVSSDGIRDSNLEKGVGSGAINTPSMNVCNFANRGGQAWRGRYAGTNFNFGQQYRGI